MKTHTGRVVAHFAGSSKPLELNLTISYEEEGGQLHGSDAEVLFNATQEVPAGSLPRWFDLMVDGDCLAGCDFDHPTTFQDPMPFRYEGIRTPEPATVGRP
jgi:hypothetical protein